MIVARATTSLLTVVGRCAGVVLLVMAGFGATGADARDVLPLPVATGQMILENPQALYFPGDRVEFQFSGCAPTSSTRLELRSDASSGTPLAVYPSPMVNVGGYIRSAVLLPSIISRGASLLVLECTSVDGYAVTASVALQIESHWPDTGGAGAGQLTPPASAVGPRTPPWSPPTVPPTRPLAHTGFEASTGMLAMVMMEAIALM